MVNNYIKFEDCYSWIAPENCLPGIGEQVLIMFPLNESENWHGTLSQGIKAKFYLGYQSHMPLWRVPEEELIINRIKDIKQVSAWKKNYDK